MRNLVFIWSSLFLTNPCVAGTITLNDNGARRPSMLRACQTYRLDHQRKGGNAYSVDWCGFSNAFEKIKKIVTKFVGERL